MLECIVIFVTSLYNDGTFPVPEVYQKIQFLNSSCCIRKKASFLASDFHILSSKRGTEREELTYGACIPCEERLPSPLCSQGVKEGESPVSPL